MSLKKCYKIFIVFLGFCAIVSLIYYFNLSNRHKAIVKTKVLHFLNIIDSDWSINLTDSVLEIESPSLLIDQIYKSMEGPKTSQYFRADQSNDDLLWMTGFKVVARHSKSGQMISNDFICHTNINYIEQEHHGRWNLLDRIDTQYPRLISLSHGIESVNFPKGYGFPFFADEQFFMITQALNHNVTDSTFQTKHNISIAYEREKLKPLMPKTIYMQLPFDIETIADEDINTIDANSCIPVETKNHTYFDKNGNLLSGHWKINLGEQEFKYNVTAQLGLKDTLRLHQITPHLHPFAKQFVLRDITANEIIYNCSVTNHTNTIGLTKTPGFSSQKGVLMYPGHDYELILTTNNTTDKLQDMMASLFMFFYDAEMAKKIDDYYEAH